MHAWNTFTRKYYPENMTHIITKSSPCQAYLYLDVPHMFEGTQYINNCHKYYKIYPFFSFLFLFVGGAWNGRHNFYVLCVVHGFTDARCAAQGFWFLSYFFCLTDGAGCGRPDCTFFCNLHLLWVVLGRANARWASQGSTSPCSSQGKPRLATIPLPWQSLCAVHSCAEMHNFSEEILDQQWQPISTNKGDKGERVWHMCTKVFKKKKNRTSLLQHAPGVT